MRAFIIATEITVEDDDRYRTVGFGEITAAVKIVRKIVLVFLYCYIVVISLRLRINQTLS